MLLFKGILLGIGLFIVATMTFYYAMTPRNVGFGRVAFPAEWLGKAAMLTTGFGLGMLVMGAALIWVGRAATSHLLNQVQNMKH